MNNQIIVSSTHSSTHGDWAITSSMENISSEDGAQRKIDQGLFASYGENSLISNFTPTEELTNVVQRLSDTINHEIIAQHLRNRQGDLLGPSPDCIFTLTTSGGYRGFYAKSKWSNHQGTYLDQIMLNMSAFKHGDIKDIAQTICHELLHAKQYHDGKPGKGNYHNRQFSNWMKCCGLQTSQTGKPGGRDIGVGMSQYINLGGVFDQAIDRLIATGFSLPWEVINSFGSGHTSAVATAPSKKAKDPSKTRFNCPKCGNSRIWGKPSTKVACLQPACNMEPLRSEVT